MNEELTKDSINLQKKFNKGNLKWMPELRIPQGHENHGHGPISKVEFYASSLFANVKTMTSCYENLSKMYYSEAMILLRAIFENIILNLYISKSSDLETNLLFYYKTTPKFLPKSIIKEIEDSKGNYNKFSMSKMMALIYGKSQKKKEFYEIWLRFSNTVHNNWFDFSVPYTRSPFNLLHEINYILYDLMNLAMVHLSFALSQLGKKFSDENALKEFNTVLKAKSDDLIYLDEKLPVGYPRGENRFYPSLLNF